MQNLPGAPPLLPRCCPALALALAGGLLSATVEAATATSPPRASSEVRGLDPERGLEAPRPEDDGWPDRMSVRLGIGSNYGVGGIQLGASWAFEEARLELGAFGGVGLAPGEEQAPSQPLYTGGVRLRWGSSHRLAVELGYEVIGVQEYSVRGVLIAKELEFGVGLRLGYEYLFSSGLLLHLGLGPGWAPKVGVLGLGSGALGVGMQWGGP